MIYPFDADLTRKYVMELIDGRRNVISVHFKEEYDFTVSLLQKEGVKYFDSMDTPEDVIIERLCQHCESTEFIPLDLDMPAGMSASNDGWNCICAVCGKLTK
jgi:hypothetical protein